MSGHPGSVLIIEDDVDIREALAEILESEGFDVTTASTVQSALELLGQLTPPIMVVMEQGMPETRREDFLRRVRADPAFRHISITFAIVTASGLTLLPDPQGSS